MGALSSIPHGRRTRCPVSAIRVRFESTKVGQVPRDGVVTAVDGELLHIAWSTGGESSLIPGAGSITNVSKVSGRAAAKRTTKKRAPARKAAKKAGKKSGLSQETDPSPKGREEGCEETGSGSQESCPEGG